MKHIYEHAGVMLAVQYERDAQGEVTFQSIRALGADYQPTGPDLTPLLDTACLICEAVTEDGRSEAVRFLSAIVEELP